MKDSIVTFRLNEETKLKLRELARTKGQTMSSLIRIAVEALVERPAAFFDDDTSKPEI